MREFGKEDSEEKTTCVREVGGEGRSIPRVPIGIRGGDDCVGRLPFRQERAKQPWEERKAGKGLSKVT